ncbi:MAG: hypothetical protein M9953_06550 [Thermomicrobiales bacterium]|nr:hypothetical protein [Thermomicrobiales bacterium]MCO5227784.1 hypothetical protein [Thermomicrobiales bacterium]
MIRIFLVVTLAFTMTTAATPSPTGQNPYASDFTELRSESTNPVVLEIIADDKITDEENEQLIAGMMTCIADAGYPDAYTDPSDMIPGSISLIWSLPEATPGATPVDPQTAFAAYDAATTPCFTEWARAMALRDAIFVNPDKRNIYELNLECLHTYHLVPADFTYTNIEHAAMTGDWGPDVFPGAPEFTLCLVNPLQIGLEPMPVAAANNPYAIEFEAARNATSNELQLQILADDQITAKEYELVVIAFLACMENEGYTITLDPDPLNPAVPYYVWSMPVSLTDEQEDTYDDTFDACSREWKSEVEMLYGAIIANPENKPWDQMYRDCLVHTGVLPPDFTLEDFQNAEVSNSWPDGVDIFSDEFAVCIGNPANPVELPLATSTNKP